jgi:purine-binding chemotaxis protein CheW
MNVRDTVIPLMDLRRRFGKEPSGTKERIILVQVEQERLGLLVDSVHEILSLLPEEVISPPSIFKGFKTEYLTGLGKKDERVIILLNIDNILTAEEKIQLKESKGILEESDAGNYRATQ